jgi:hypothetical protein
MATQEGIIQLKGTIGNITFLKTRDGYLAKQKSGVSGDRIAKDAAFARTRENNSEFGRAGKAGKILRKALNTLLKDAKDRRVSSRLTKEMMKVIKADATSTRGQRNVVDGEAELLQGFEFNINAIFSSTVSMPYTTVIDRATGKLEADIPSFTPANGITIPNGATHYKLVSAGVAIDFETGNFEENSSSTAIMPWDENATAAIKLSNTITANSTHPLFLLMGVQFFQLVNGINYPLKNGTFNALAIVKVSGV